jgi:hypothetical protein
MQHLSSERLAAFADDEPTAAEAMHLASCAECARERRVHQELFAVARRTGERADAPLSDWTSLSSQLVNEGLISQPVAAGQGPAGSLGRIGALAASLLLLAGAVAAGRMSAGADPFPGLGVASRPVPEVDTTAPAEFTSAAEALNVFLRAQRDLERSAAYLETTDRSSEASPSAVWARLAALEEIRSASIAGLRDAPTDPLLNNIYVSTLNASQSTMRELSRVVPAGMKVTRY